jgi:hypothetical protein
MRQANSVPVSKDDLQIDLGCLSQTVPDRMARTDYGYGDKYERLAVARNQLTAVRDYCQNCGSDGCQARFNSSACKNILIEPGSVSNTVNFDSIFEPTSASLVGLSAYGIAGRITSPLLNVFTGKNDYISLLEIRYCSFFSDYTKTGRLKDLIDDGWTDDFSWFVFNYAFEDTIWKEIKDVEIPCTAPRKRRSAPKKSMKDVDRKYTVSRRHQLHVDNAKLLGSSGMSKNQVSHSICLLVLYW